jgi:hypothetical protein
MEETREHRPDETTEQKTTREVTENHVQGIEQAVFRGQLSRKQADRVIDAGQKVHKSYDMARGVSQRGE